MRTKTSGRPLAEVSNHKSGITHSLEFISYSLVRVTSVVQFRPFSRESSNPEFCAATIENIPMRRFGNRARPVVAPRVNGRARRPWQGRRHNPASDPSPLNLN